MKRLVCKESWKKMVVLLVLLIINVMQVSADDDFTLNISPVSPQAPTAAEFVKYIDYPVSKYTGIPDISIPLYTINAGNISIPLSISYHASGIKANQEATSVGLGWSLNASGIITRSIVCGDDLCEPGSTNKFNTGYLDMPMVKEFNDITTEHCNGGELVADSEPDIFCYNIPGFSGKFVFTKKDDANVIPVQIDKEKANVRIELRRYDNTFVITDGGGNRYFFSVKEKTQHYYVSSDNTNGEIEGLDFDIRTNFTSLYRLSDSSEFTSSWYLNKIISAMNDTVDFEYDEEAYQLPLQESCTKYTIKDITFYENSRDDGFLDVPPTVNSSGFSTTEIHHTRTKNVIHTPRLRSIKWRQGKVSLEYSDREDLIGRYNLSSLLPGKVESIEIADDSNTKIHRYVFSYSYFNDNTTYNKTTLYKRLRLDSLKDELNNGCDYSFGYIGGRLPAKNTKNVDYWGFYNGEYYGKEYYSAAYDESGYYMGALKQTKPDYMKVGTLCSVKQPTGDIVSMEYEPNTYIPSMYITTSIRQSYVGTFCGNRTLDINGDYEDIPEEESDTIVLADGQNKIKMNFEYYYIGMSDSDCLNGDESYLKGDDTHPSFSVERLNTDGTKKRVALYYMPDIRGKYFGYEHVELTLPQGRYVISSHSQRTAWNVVCQMGYSVKSFVKRTDVTVPGGGLRIKKIYSGKNVCYNYENGKALVEPIYYYPLKIEKYNENLKIHLADAHYMVQLSECTIPLTTLKGSYCFGYDKVTELFDDGSRNVYEYNNRTEMTDVHPMLHSKMCFDNGLLRSITTYDADAQKKKKISYEYTHISSPDTIFAFYYYGHGGCPYPYRYIIQWPVLHNMQTQTYYGDANDIVEERRLSYDKELRVIRDSISSHSSSYTTHYTYASEASTSLAQKIREKNMLQLPSEVIMTRNGSVIKGKRTDYAEQDGIILPYSESLLETDQPLSLANYGKAFNTKITASEYTKHGHPMQMSTDGENTVFLWGYKDTYIVAKIGNADYKEVKALLGDNFIKTLNEAAEPTTYQLQQLRELGNTLPKSDVTIYSYEGLKGLTSKITSNGNTENYEYDAAGRLIRMKENGATREEYQYNYRK